MIVTEALKKEVLRGQRGLLRLTVLQNSVSSRKVKQQKGSSAKAKCKLTFELSPAGN